MRTNSMPEWLRESAMPAWVRTNTATSAHHAEHRDVPVLADEERLRLVKAGVPVYGPEERILELCEQAAIRSDARIC